MRLRAHLKYLEELLAAGGGGASAQTVEIPSVAVPAGQTVIVDESIPIEYGHIYAVSFAMGSIPHSDTADPNLAGPYCPGTSPRLIGSTQVIPDYFGGGDAFHLTNVDSNGVNLRAAWIIGCDSGDIVQPYFQNQGTVPVTVEDIVLVVKEIA